MVVTKKDAESNASNLSAGGTRAPISTWVIVRKTPQIERGEYSYTINRFVTVFRDAGFDIEVVCAEDIDVVLTRFCLYFVFVFLVFCCFVLCFHCCVKKKHTEITHFDFILCYLFFFLRQPI